MNERRPHDGGEPPRARPDEQAARAENRSLRRELQEARDTIEAIRRGDVDAVVVATADGERVYALETADQTYRHMVEQMQQGAAVLTADGLVVYANPQLESLAEGPKSVVGRLFPTLFPLEEGEAVRALLRDAGARPVSLESRIVGPGSRRVPVYLSASPLRTEGASVCVMVTDLTERDRYRDLEAALREFRTVSDTSPVPIWVTDHAGTLRFVNKAWAEFFSIPRESLSTLDWTRLLHPEDAASYSASFEASRADRAEFRAEARVRRADGEWRWVTSYGAPWFSAGGEYLGCVGSSPDVTEMKRIELALKQADIQKDRFLATLAHELRNPLAPIRNAVAVLKAKAPALPELRWGHEVIDRQVEHMARLLDDLLDVSRVTQNKLRLRLERVELQAVLAAAVETSRPLVDAHRHQLSVRMPPEPVYVDADPVRLSQAVANLLNNAAKYTDAGGRIWLAAERSSGELRVSVRDTGIGIGRAALPGVFEMFSQTSGAAERAEGGLGIGLSLVRGLVELHGGTIEARSDGPGRGSEFVIRLTEAGAAAAGVEREAAPAEPPPCALRVLVADDSRDTAESLGLFLTLQGCQVRTAFDGDEALAAAEEFRPDVALLDVGMPKLTGYDVARLIRERPWGRHVVLVAQTGWGRHEDQQRTLESGFDHHLVKPVAPAALRELLATVRAAAPGGVR